MNLSSSYSPSSFFKVKTELNTQFRMPSQSPSKLKKLKLYRETNRVIEKRAVCETALCVIQFKTMINAFWLKRVKRLTIITRMTITICALKISVSSLCMYLTCSRMSHGTHQAKGRGKKWERELNILHRENVY